MSKKGIIGKDRFREAGKAWKKLGLKEREVYARKAAKEAKRFEKDVVTYNESFLKLS
jgi:hypothetical protein